MSSISKESIQEPEPSPSPPARSSSSPVASPLPYAVPRTPLEPRRDLPVPVRTALTRLHGTTTIEYAVNLSAGGACLQVRQPLAPGERIHLAFELPQDEIAVSVEARVIWCTREEEHGGRSRFFEMGVQFEHTDAALREQLGRFARQPVNRRR